MFGNIALLCCPFQSLQNLRYRSQDSCSLSRTSAELKLRSWSWASADGPIFFLGPFDKESICRNIFVANDGSLALICLSRELLVSPYPKYESNEFDLWHCYWMQTDPRMTLGEGNLVKNASRYSGGFVLEGDGHSVSMAYLDQAETAHTHKSMICAILAMSVTLNEDGPRGVQEDRLTYGGDERYFGLLLAPKTTDAQAELARRQCICVMVQTSSLNRTG